MSSKSMSQILKTLFQTGDINISALCGAVFSRYVWLKSSFPDEKAVVKSETHFSREAVENCKSGKVLKENSIIGRSLNYA